MFHVKREIVLNAHFYSYINATATNEPKIYMAFAMFHVEQLRRINSPR